MPPLPVISGRARYSGRVHHGYLISTMASVVSGLRRGPATQAKVDAVRVLGVGVPCPSVVAEQQLNYLGMSSHGD